MLTSTKLNDASIVHKYELSQKEKALKAKLFSKKSAEKAKHSVSFTKENTQSTQSTNYENNNPNLPQHMASTLSSTQFKDSDVNRFLSSMESEFREINKSIQYIQSSVTYNFIHAFRTSHNGDA